MSARKIRAAVAQFAPKLGDLAANAATCLGWIEKATRNSIDLLVLPECCLTGYNFDNADRLRAVGDNLGTDQVDIWQGICARTGLTLVAGIVEHSQDTLYNTAIVLSPQTRPLTYRKIHLWGIERRLYRAGDTPLIATTPAGRVGISICYDLWFPELSRALRLGGADLLASPANWAGNPNLTSMLDTDGRAMGFHLARSTACVNEMPVLVADRVGTEGDIRFLGNSCIVNAAGEAVAGPANDTEETLLEGSMDVGAQAGQQSHLGARRPKAYETLTMRGGQ